MEISLENCMWVFRWYWRARIIMQYLLPVVFMHQTSRFWCQAIYHAMKLWIYEIEDITGRAVIRNFSSSVENYFKILFFLLYKHQWNTKPFHSNSFWYERHDLLCSHSKGDIFTCEDNMLFSHVKIASFRAKAHGFITNQFYDLLPVGLLA